MPKTFLNSPLRWLVIVLSIGLFAFNGWSSNEARKHLSNRVIDWLPAGTPELEDFFHYYRLFPEGELLMVSWEGCDRADPRLDDIARRLCETTGDADKPYFDRTLTTRSMIDELTAPPVELERREARRRLAGWLIGKDGQTACLVALISEYGNAHRAAAIKHVFDTVKNVTKLSENEIHIAGPSIDSVAIDEISAHSQQVLLPFFLAFCLILLLCCLRHFFPALVIFFVAMMNEELGGTLLYWTGAHVDSISMLISSLVYVLTISAGVHLVNYYRETLRDGADAVAAPLEMVRKAAVPCALSAITTVLGMGSLAVSQMIPIQTFGKYASFALLFGTAWLFLVVTAVFQQFPVKSWSYKPQDDRGDENKKKTRPSRWNAFARWVERGRRPITIIGFLLLAFCAVGVGHLQTTVSFHGMLPKTAKVIQDYNFLENNIGGLIPVEIVLSIPDRGNDEQTLLDQLYVLKEMEDVLSPIDGIECTVSALTFTPDLPERTERTVQASGRRTAMNRLLGDRVNLLEQARFYRNAENEAFWRMSLRISTQSKVKYEALLHDIRTQLETLKHAELGQKFSRLEFLVTGGVPLVHLTVPRSNYWKT